jgi:hypothetical protein
MARPVNILLQTTIPTTVDDWHIGRFGLLRKLLEEVVDEAGEPVFSVSARDRVPPGQPDPVLSSLDTSEYDQLWLFAVDTGDGLTPEDCHGISRFRQRGGGMLVTRDHMDLGSSVCNLGGVGAAHHFHTANPDPDLGHRQIDDPYTTQILWPNYHSGANGDFQEIDIVGPLHPVLLDTDAVDGRIRYLPAHPHEGGVSAPADDPSARVIAVGQSAATGAVFNIAVAFEPSSAGGPAIAHSTFHHFADYNWNIGKGAPTFVTELPGDGMTAFPEALRSSHHYARNVALWLAGRPTASSGAA